MHPDALFSTVRLRGTLTALAGLLIFALGFSPAQSQHRGGFPSSIPCDPDNGGLTLPDGYCAVVVADSLGPTRHLAVRDNGDVYARLRENDGSGSVVALRDTDQDGRADVIRRFADEDGGTGLEIYDGHVYYSTTVSVHRVPLAEGSLVPTGESETIVSGFPEQDSHAAKSLAVDPQDRLYVNVGAPSNSCQEQNRTPQSPGQDPCPLLERHAGIWQFSATEAGQTQTEDGQRFATGIRNAVALDWNPVSAHVYLAMHGRDQLAQNWGDTYSLIESAILPAEEVFMVDEGDHFGWPYSYYDWVQKKKVLSPEYGGDGMEVGRASQYEDPIIAFPGHWGPNDLVAYTGNQFPGRYHDGMFIAFHGSWNRAPIPQEGYNVVFVPMDGAVPKDGRYETFADGFKGAEPLMNPGEAEYRPTGLAVGPKGSLYVSDDAQGRIWRIVYKGTR